MRKYTAFLISVILLLTGCSDNQSSTTDTAQSGTQESTSETQDVIIITDTESTDKQQDSKNDETTTTEETLPLTVTVTIPEGFTVSQIAERLEKNHVCDAEGFLDAVNNYDFTYYPLVAKIANTENRAFRLEGYLYPETYEFYTGDAPEDACGKFLRQTEASLTDIDAQAQSKGYTLDEILTIASIIQKECGNIDEMNRISAVIHNRLDIGMRLQCDVTINYIEDKVKPYIDGDKDRYNALYNTYKCAALPAGPICNPSMAAIKAALSPDTSCDALFFFTDKDKNYIYSNTYDEHTQKMADAGIKV